MGGGLRGRHVYRGDDGTRYIKGFKWMVSRPRNKALASSLEESMLSQDILVGLSRQASRTQLSLTPN